VDGYERFGIAYDRGASAGQSRRFSALSQRELRFTDRDVDFLSPGRLLAAWPAGHRTLA